MSIGSVVIALAIAAAGVSIVAPAAVGHTANCSIGYYLSYGLYCEVRCEANQKWKVDADSTDERSYVQAFVDCGNVRSVNCAYYGFCNGYMISWTNMHDDLGDCSASQDRYAQFYVTCYLWQTQAFAPSSGNEVQPAEEEEPAAVDCSTEACLFEIVGGLMARVQPGAHLEGPATVYHIVGLEESALGYACNGVGGLCVPMPPACEVAEGVRTCTL